ncbi:MAG: hypothetical protein N3B21_01690 [Clostridia bacterium]|nr:hypothetical protein [Clostridia bacterium]
MGSGRWSTTDWAAYSKKNISSKSRVDDIYTSRSLAPELNPYGVKIRESCDSSDNPQSTALVVALDVTGSMGMVLDAMAREGLQTLATEVYNRKPISDPHIMFMGIGDVEAGDRAPLQVTQFEADIRIAEQLTKIYLERGGGGNSYESYALAWYFAAMHTRIDCFEKRGKKGFLFTIGDEQPTPYLRASDIERVLGYRPQSDRVSSRELLNMAARQYEVFHLIVEEGSHFRCCGDKVVDEWTELLGQRAIRLSDHTKMSEVIVSTIQVVAGADVNKVISSWDGTTGLVVAKAIGSLSNSVKKAIGGIVRF